MRLACYPGPNLSRDLVASDLWRNRKGMADFIDERGIDDRQLVYEAYPVPHYSYGSSL